MYPQIRLFVCVAVLFGLCTLCPTLSAQNCGIAQSCSNAQSCGNASASCSAANSGSMAVQSGPGTEMTKMINRIGLGSNCGRCKALANQMDMGGPEWVRQNRQYVVQRTISNASNLGHKMGPIKRVGVRVLVQRAIRKSIR